MDNQVSNTKETSKSPCPGEHQWATNPNQGTRSLSISSIESPNPPLNHNTVHPGSWAPVIECANWGPAQIYATAMQEPSHTLGASHENSISQASSVQSQEQYLNTSGSVRTSHSADETDSTAEGAYMLRVYVNDTQSGSDTGLLSRMGQDLDATFSVHVREDANVDGQSREGEWSGGDGPGHRWALGGSAGKKGLYR